MGGALAPGGPRGAIVGLARAVRDAQDAAMAARTGGDARERFERALKMRDDARRRRRISFAAAAAAIAAVAASVLVAWPTRPVSFTVRDRRGAVGEWIAPVQDLPLHFSDGTAIVLGADAVASVSAAGARGADIALRSGRLRASVVHTGQSRWNVDAGPFRVHVTGTRFDAAWDDRTQQFTLDLHEGLVVVTGCSMAAEVVGAGTSLQARCDRGQAVVARSLVTDRDRPSPSSATLASEPSARPLAPPAQDDEVRPQPLPSAPKPPREAHDDRADGDAIGSPSASVGAALSAPARWQDLAAAGRNAEALDAEKARFEDDCRRASAPDLLLLADVARYAGDTERARKALLAVRARFPGAEAAVRAAFLLGRLAFDRGGFSDAALWFEAAGAESPTGPLARDADGRLVEAYDKAGNTAAAREAARRYLSRYPSGPHARLATRLLGR